MLFRGIQCWCLSCCRFGHRHRPQFKSRPAPDSDPSAIFGSAARFCDDLSPDSAYTIDLALDSVLNFDSGPTIAYDFGSALDFAPRLTPVSLSIMLPIRMKIGTADVSV
ncbi:hypothetical protein EVAR_87231_1 [Eumeta japonica]|uniref:Uncharacterized protein n=1 Tax=Eumeta variegata TaxID=151549 RepID=A0A4C1ZU50_EUMVA|nr:hypothetical protein EVAR_87231_1 [Eumeta japonica]